MRRSPLGARAVLVGVLLSVCMPSHVFAEGDSGATPPRRPAPAPSPARRPAVRIASVVVELDTQTAFVYSRSGRLLTSLPVSTGVDDTTPTGSFRVFSKSAQAYYTPAPNERMRWMVRFTRGRGGDNIGFHGIPYKVTAAGEIPFETPVGQEASSHGCVRMRVNDAKWLFDNISLGTPVRVVKSRHG